MPDCSQYKNGTNWKNSFSASINSIKEPDLTGAIFCYLSTRGLNFTEIQNLDNFFFSMGKLPRYRTFLIYYFSGQINKIPGMKSSFLVHSKIERIFGFIGPCNKNMTFCYTNRKLDFVLFWVVLI